MWKGFFPLYKALYINKFSRFNVDPMNFYISLTIQLCSYNPSI